MLTYLIYPDHYWPEPYYYWPLILLPVPPYDTIEPCGGAVWIVDEDLAPTGNTVLGLDGVPFAVHEELAETGNTYFRVEDTPPVADSDSPSYFGVWKKKGHS